MLGFFTGLGFWDLLIIGFVLLIFLGPKRLPQMGRSMGGAIRGFKDAVKDAKGVKIVASQTANWERDQGFTVFQNMLEAHPEIDAVFSANDMMALGAVEAIAAKGKTGKIKVVGYDAVEDAKKAIADGTIMGSVAQFPSEMGRVAVESADKLLKGQPVPAEQLVRIDLVTKDKPAGSAPGAKQ